MFGECAAHVAVGHDLHGRLLACLKSASQQPRQADHLSSDIREEAFAAMAFGHAADSRGREVVEKPRRIRSRHPHPRQPSGIAPAAAVACLARFQFVALHAGARSWP